MDLLCSESFRFATFNNVFVSRKPYNCNVLVHNLESNDFMKYFVGQDVCVVDIL